MDSFREPHQPGLSDEFEDLDEFEPRRTDLFGRLIALVGDADALWRLDASPLRDEPFDFSAVEARDVPFVMQVLARSDRSCDELLDTEFRTIARRMLARARAHSACLVGYHPSGLSARALCTLRGQLLPESGQTSNLLEGIERAACRHTPTKTGMGPVTRHTRDQASVNKRGARSGGYA